MTTDLSRLTASLADRYRIERELGQGGMATVYLGHDLKHDRDVAIKVLHPDLGAALGGERFLSEIRTTARLQHPHILPLLDSGAADTFLYYVMPYVAGETLRSRLERERQLPLEDALRIAREVADALGAAHALGIIHRDIKPENILLQGGHALVADFGIALAVQHAAGQRMTQTGLSLGTPQYMSPEQAMGEKTLDARSDIYALGAVTYEMLVGEPPFTGPTVQTIVAKVLTERPTAPRAVRDTVPAGVEHAVMKALAKLPADRFATAEKFAEALNEDARSAERYVGTAPTALPTVLPTYRLTALIAALLVATAALAWWLGRRSGTPDAAWSTFTQLTDASGAETGPSLSPDGESFGYASNARGSWDIYVQRVGGRNPVLVAGDSALDEVWPAYSPDGKQLAYSLRGGGIFLVGATGESARRLTTFGSNPAWSPDGRRIVFCSEEVNSAYNVNNTGTLWTVETSGGEPRRLDPSGGRGFYQPAWSPAGTRIAFWSVIGGQRDLETIPADGGPRVKLTDDAAVDWAPAWSPDGKQLYFASDRGGTMGLWRIAVDEASGRAKGSPVLVASGVDVDMDLPHLSRDGSALIFRSKLESVNPAALAFDPAAARLGAVTLLQHRTGILVPTDMSPDGKWLALNNAPDRRQDIFIMRPDGSELRRLTDDDARDWTPRFTPDGAALTFFSNSSGKYDSWSIRLDGSGRTRLTDVKDGTSFAMFAPDGKRLMAAGIDTGAFVGEAPWPLTDKSATPLRAGVEGGVLNPSYWSRDGRWLSGYIVSQTGEADGQGIYGVAAGRAYRLNHDSRSYDVAWLPDNRRVIYFTNRGTLVMQDILSLERREITGQLPYPPDLLGSITAARDGRTLYYGARQTEANLWLVKRSSPGTRAP
jgi:Tol biopolymer transport system component/tRNA A-37 threonylcarbamoyl transferase component Bud32